MKLRYIFPLVLGLLTQEAVAKTNPVPRFVSLRPNEVNGRVGPGSNYPVEWVYIKAGLPVEVVAEFDTWRKVKDSEGDEVWVHQSLLNSSRTALIHGAEGSEVLMYRDANTKSQPLVRLQKGVLVQLLRCKDDWCQVKIFDFKGWVLRNLLWGVYPQEKIH